MSLRIRRKWIIVVSVVSILTYTAYLFNGISDHRKERKRVNDQGQEDRLSPRTGRRAGDDGAPGGPGVRIDGQMIDIEGGNSQYDRETVGVEAEAGKCPACLGTGYCSQLNGGKVGKQLNIQEVTESNGKIIRKAVLGPGKGGHEEKAEKRHSLVTLLTPTSERWLKFDGLICSNSSAKSKPCNPSQALLNSFMVQSDIFEVNKFRQLLNIYRELRPKENISFFFKCVTEKYIEFIRSAFDENRDNYLDVSEQAHLLTSLLVFPTYASFRFQAKTNLDLPLVKLKGVCGRLLVYDGDLTPLSEFMENENSFESKAGVAVQLIQMVQDFQEGDANWFLLHTNLIPSKLLVTKEGELLVEDLDDVVIFDKAILEKSETHVLRSQVCNGGCFEKYHRLFVASDQPDCYRIPSYYGDQMYVMMCKNIFQVCSEKGSSNCSGGLLNSVPSKDADAVSDLVRECIYETSPGGRRQAVQELRDILKGFLRFEDNDNESEDNDNDVDDKPEEEPDQDKDNDEQYSRNDYKQNAA